MLNIVNYLNEKELFSVLDKYNAFDIKSHGKKVSIYAMGLLDSLSPYYQFKDEEINLLRYSALLHDIGYFINKKSHHKHTKFIILNEPLLDNMPKSLRDNLALITSGHGKSIDDTLNFHPKVTVLKLLSILRIADALDHKHNLNISLEKVEIKDNALNIRINGEGSNIIMKSINKKSHLFSKIYNIEVLVDCN
ncbi:HD domain-containing protein [Clostridium bowmanii]|uniref:HD domain-containing protein n=1 Tax=Clostridium bowmanii TaxID=132925 RepID=UPI001C0AB126|nr:HD domain-containing protein [Clostridium bowmanii]MBU3189675.1 HD domain-containing protein [Clostridium bowmanii]MCA1073480.1 HD domain-containing protein [Clostridium bowmanii]